MASGPLGDTLGATVARPSGTVSFLFTDVEGSTALWQARPVAMRDALVVHDRLVRVAAGMNGGRVFATSGDGFAVAFARASDGALAGVESGTATTNRYETTPPSN